MSMTWYTVSLDSETDLYAKNPKDAVRKYIKLLEYWVKNGNESTDINCWVKAHPHSEMNSLYNHPKDEEEHNEIIL